MAEVQFQPKWDEPTLRNLIKSYEQNPTAFSENLVNNIKEHAGYHNVPFHEGDFSIVDSIQELGKGFAEGFTTLNLFEPADNEYEAIFRNLGHLGGFAPGIIGAPLGAAARVLGKNSIAAGSLLNAAKMARQLNDKSVPMMFANKATKVAKDITKPLLTQGRKAQTSAVNTASNFLLGNQAKHIAEGAFHLGAASAISSWQGGVDQMMSSFLHGGMAGGVFRSIGNFMTTGAEGGNKVAKALAGSLFMGLPATMRGATTAEQVYEYTLGAWFGGKEMPWSVAKGQKWMQKEFIPGIDKHPEIAKGGYDPEFHPKFKDLPSEVQPVVKEMAAKQFGDFKTNAAMNYFASLEAGLDLEALPEGFKPEYFQKVKTESGETKYRLKGDTYVVTGASGKGDAYIARLAGRRGASPIHFISKGQYIQKKQTPGYIKELTKPELEEANQAVTDANLILKKNLKQIKPRELDLIRKNYHVIKNTNQVILVGNLSGQYNRRVKPTKTGVEWAHQMAVDSKKPLYLFDQASQGWLKWKTGETNAFVPISEPPKLPKATAFISEPYLKRQTQKVLGGFFNTALKKPKKLVKNINQIEKDDNDVLNLTDADVGSIPTNNKAVGTQSMRFVDNVLNKAGKIYEGETVPAFKAEKMGADMVRVEKLMEEHLNPGEKQNRSEEFIDKVVEEFNLNLKKKDLDQTKLETRQWFQRRNSEEQLEYVTIDGDNLTAKLMKDMNTTLGGERKINREAPKIVDVVWREKYGKKGRAFAIIDHITIKDDKGFHDIGLSKFRTSQRKDINAGEKAYYNLISKTLNKLSDAKEGGFYYFGGNGTTDRMTLVKFHPEMNKVSDSIILKPFNKLMIKNLRKDFVDRMSTKDGMTRKEATEYFNKGFKSNILWHLSLNGLEITPENLKKISSTDYIDINNPDPTSHHWARKTKEQYDKMSAKMQDNYLPEFDFIKNAVAWNKRSQIWMTDSHSGNREFYEPYIDNNGVKKYKLEGFEAGDNFKYVLFEDLPIEFKKLNHRDVSLKSTESPEHVDGGIYARTDVLRLNNQDAGTSMEATQNKSFIVSPNSEKGALLGKYMMHDAGAKISKWMKDRGIHYVIPESAAKQRGARQFDTIYNDLSPEHIKFNYSVIQNNNNIRPQSVKKQILGNLVSHLSMNGGPKMKKIVNEIYDELILPSFRGDKITNQRLEDYHNLDPNTPHSKLEKALDKIDFEKIGIEPLISALKKPGNQLFARRAYEMMFRFAKEDLNEAYENGEVDVKTYESQLKEINEFDSVQNRVITQGLKYAQEMKKPENAVSLYNHNFIKDYRMSVLTNWIIKKATQPKIPNSGSARMRPYDIELQERYPELDTNDGIYYLDNAFKRMEVDTGIKNIGTMQLGRLWSMYSKGNFNKQPAIKKQVEDVFSSVVARVPMGAISGAQILKFRGFTEREGHGILLHSRTMKALEGADLDGDSAYFYMGGKKGFRNNWQEMYANNKKEFYKKEKGKTLFMENKEKEFEEGPNSLVKQYTPEEKVKIDSIEGMFSPNTRMDMSNAAVDGRQLLGGAAVQPKQVMASVYNTLVDKGEDTFKFEKKSKVKGKWITDKYEMTIKPRTSKKEKDYARRLGRAQIGYSSDPMDFAGLTDYNTWYKGLYKAHFNITSMKKNGKKLTSEKQNKEFDKISPTQLKEGGIFGMIEKANSAFYGRNYSENRKWTMDERMEMTSKLHTLRPEELNTMTPKIARLLSEIDYSDNPLARMSKPKVEELFKNWKIVAKEYDSLLKPLGRTTFKVGTHEYIDATMIHKLFTSEGMRKTYKDINEFRKAISGTGYALKEYEKEWGESNPSEWHRLQARKRILREIRDKASDFIIKDITDLMTARRVKETVDAMIKEEGLSKAQANDIIEQISKSVDHLKQNSYLMARARKRYIPEYEGNIDEQVIDNLVKDLAKNPKLKNRISFLKTKEESTAYMDQNTIDKTIMNLKKHQYTTPRQQELFDNLLLGSLNRGDLAAIDAFQKGLSKKGKLHKIEYQVLSQLRQDAARTSMSRVGFSSNAVPDKSIKSFIGEYSDIFEQVSVNRGESFNKKLGEDLVNKPQAEENKKKGLPEDPLRDLEEFVTQTTGLEGLKKIGKKAYEEGYLDAETKDYISRVMEHVKLENNKVAEGLPLIVRSLLNKDFNMMNKADWRFMKNWFDDVRGGTLWQRIKGGNITELSSRHYMQFPETINRELMKDELVLMQEKGLFKTLDGVKTGKVLRPTQYMDLIQEAITRTSEEATALGEKATNKLAEDLLFVQELEDYGSLHELAIRFRERPLANKMSERKDIKNEKINYADAQEYIKTYDEAIKRLDYDNSIKNKEYTITLDGQRVKKRGEEIIELINERYTEFFKNMHKIISGDVPTNRRGDAISNIPESLHKHKLIVDYYDKNKKSPKIDHAKFTRLMSERWQEGKSLPLEFGIDGLHLVARSMMIEMTKDPVKRKHYMASEPNQTGKIDFENYWPHLHFSKKEALASLKNYVKHIRSSDLSEKEIKEHLNKITYKHHALTGDWKFEDIDEWKEHDMVQDLISKKMKDKENRISYFDPNKKTGSMMGREAHLPGWSIDANVAASYGRSLYSAYFRQMGQIMGRNHINNFSTNMFKKMGKETTNNWTNFLKLWIQGAAGNPDVIPKHILEDKGMKIRKTPFAWFADNIVKDRINSIGDKLGLIKKDLPENMRGIDIHQLRHLSNLEAKFELASLLAHPRSVVNNIFGGQAHTIQSVGFKTWKDARDLKELAKINPKLNTKQAVDDFVTGHGVNPEYLLHEYALKTEYQSVKNKKFVEDIAGKLRRDPNLSTESIMDIGRKSGITEPIMKWAAKFMSVPERALRRDAFMAHYMHWYRKFGGAIQDINHPVLIELAKKGVKATQFLYSAPQRPMFARTALGKVMTRFQLWGWNAVRFRKDALKQAKLYGFKGDEAERAARIMQMDLFVFALGNMFAYSLFDTAMPSPWNWVQDTADWVFGDENERNRAFFGQWPRAVAPLQTVTPPILRMPMAAMRGILEDDWSRVSDYYVYTMLPFGRIIRDFHGPNNLIENPHGLIDKWTGVPVIQAGKVSKQIRTEERDIPSPGGNLF